MHRGFCSESPLNLLVSDLSTPAQAVGKQKSWCRKLQDRMGLDYTDA